MALSPIRLQEWVEDRQTEAIMASVGQVKVDSVCWDDGGVLALRCSEEMDKYSCKTQRLCTTLASLADALPEASWAFNL